MSSSLLRLFNTTGVGADGALAAPANLALSITGAGFDVITATWDAVGGAATYEIEYSDDGVTYTPVDTTALLTYDITSADYVLNVDTHYVRVRATGSSTWATASIDDLLLYLVAGWLATRASGNWDDAIGSNDGVQNGTISAVAGLFGNAAQFQRANSEYFAIAAPTDVLDVAGVDFTFVATLRITDTSDIRTAFASLHDFGQGAFYVQTDERMAYWVGSEKKATNAISANTWTQVALVVDAGTDIKIYTNTSADTLTYTSLTGTSTAAYIGNDGGGSFFDGDINQMLVYKGRALTSGKISRLYNGGSGLDVSTLL